MLVDVVNCMNVNGGEISYFVTSETVGKWSFSGYKSDNDNYYLF